jgi:hypothetical protein
MVSCTHRRSSQAPPKGEISVYDGRTLLGSLRRCGEAHEARDASGRGVFPDAKTAAAAASDSYNANADFAGSLDDCYCAVRARIAAGGKGWQPK